MAQLRELDTQLTVLEVLTKHNDDILPLLELLQAFVLDFRTSIYRQRFRKMLLNSQILPILLSVFWRIIQRWQLATVTVTMK